MNNLIIKSENKLKVIHKKNAVNHLISYKCPNCFEQMVSSSQSVFTRVDSGYEIWVCEKCNKLWRLTFQELVEAKE